MLNTTIRMDADANGKDPDTYSYQLATIHQQLWSKPLPNGEFFQLHLKGRSKVSLILKKICYYRNTEEVNQFRTQFIEEFATNKPEYGHNINQKVGLRNFARRIRSE